MCFVKNDDGIGDIVKFAATRGLCCVEGFVELNGGGDDDRRVPVFCSETRGFGLSRFGVGREIRVVLNDDVFAKW